MLAGILFFAALVTAVAIVGSATVGAQSTSPVVEVPGLDAGETGNISVDVTWNGNATVNDTATVEIDYVTDLDTGSLEQTDSHTINASPSSTTSGTFLVEPDEDVAQFEVTTEAVDANVSSVEVTSDINASGGGGAPANTSTEEASIVGGLVILIVLLGAIYYQRNR